MKSMPLETGISDHHKIIMTIFRYTFPKGKPKIAAIKNSI